MKKGYLIIIGFYMVFLASCGKLESFNDLYLRVNLSSKSLWFNFDSTNNVQSYEIIKVGNYLNFDSILKANSVDTSKVQHIRINKINLRIDTTNGISKEINFDFLKNASIACKVDSPSFSYFNLGKIDSVNFNLSSIDIPVPDIEVKDIVKFQELLYKINGWNRKPMGKTKVIVTVNYTVDAALAPK